MSVAPGVASWMTAPAERLRRILLQSVRTLLPYVPAGTTTVPPPALTAEVIVFFRLLVSVVLFPVAAGTVNVCAASLGIFGSGGSASAKLLPTSAQTKTGRK